MESSFLLLDAAGVLWFWFNDESTPKKSTFTWNEKEKITFIGCNMFRATVVLESKGCVTFYDRAFCSKFLLYLLKMWLKCVHRYKLSCYPYFAKFIEQFNTLKER